VERHFAYPRVVEMRHDQALEMARPVIRSQRSLVMASLLLCPGRGSARRV
jgi:hypothetical protein